MAVARICKNCAYVKLTPVSFDGGKTVHSISAICQWAKHVKPKKVPYWVRGWQTVHEEAPRTKAGCAAFVPQPTGSAHPASEQDMKGE